jgi:hypothetical protein
MTDWLVNLISSPGFWRGVTYLAMAGGITLAPEQENSIIAGGLALAGCIHAFSASQPKP